MPDGKTAVICRYDFPRDSLWPEDDCPGQVEGDTRRKDLMNLFLQRNDRLLNNYNEHLLLANLGNIDWRALLNLWSVLDYLTKYTAKAGTGSKQLGTLFESVLQQVQEWENEDGYHDLWRRTIMKFYNRIIGDRDDSLFEVLHSGLGFEACLICALAVFFSRCLPETSFIQKCSAFRRKVCTVR